VVNWSGSATPNLATQDNTTVCTDLTVPTTGGDSSVAKLDISGRHDFCSVLSGTWTFCIRDNDGFGDTGVLNTWSVHN
jgi:hypothetical protein